MKRRRKAALMPLYPTLRDRLQWLAAFYARRYGGALIRLGDGMIEWGYLNSRRGCIGATGARWRPY